MTRSRGPRTEMVGGVKEAWPAPRRQPWPAKGSRPRDPGLTPGEPAWVSCRLKMEAGSPQASAPGSENSRLTPTSNGGASPRLKGFSSLPPSTGFSLENSVPESHTKGDSGAGCGLVAESLPRDLWGPGFHPQCCQSKGTFWETQLLLYAAEDSWERSGHQAALTTATRATLIERQRQGNWIQRQKWHLLKFQNEDKKKFFGGKKTKEGKMCDVGVDGGQRSQLGVRKTSEGRSITGESEGFLIPRGA